MSSRSLSLRTMRTSSAPASRRALSVRAFAPSKEKEGSKEAAAPSKASATASNKKASPQKSISLKTHFVTEWGDELKIVSAPQWSLDSASPMNWREGHDWEADVDDLVRARTDDDDDAFEFKLVLQRADGTVVWEEGPNKVISAASSPSAPLRVSWGFPEVFEASEVGAEREKGEESEVVGAAEASPAVAPLAEAVISDEAAASVSSSSSAAAALVVEEEEVPVAETPEEEEAEVVVEEASAVVATAPSGATTTATEEEETKQEKQKQNIQSAAAAAALGVGGALLATALAIDVADAAVVGAAAAAVAAVAGGSNSAAGVAASKAAKAAFEAPEKLLRAAGMKSFVEREAEEKAKEEAEVKEAESEE